VSGILTHIYIYISDGSLCLAPNCLLIVSPRATFRFFFSSLFFVLLLRGMNVVKGLRFTDCVYLSDLALARREIDLAAE